MMKYISLLQLKKKFYFYFYFVSIIWHNDRNNKKRNRKRFERV